MERLYIGGRDSLYRTKAFDGLWKDNVKQGDGRLVLTNGDMVEGPFVNGMLHGFCMHYFAASGRRRLAEYVRGDRIGWRDNSLMEGIRAVKFMSKSADFKKTLLAIESGGQIREDDSKSVGSAGSKKSKNSANTTQRKTHTGTESAGEGEGEGNKNKNKNKNKNIQVASDKDKEKNGDLHEKDKIKPERLPTPGSRVRNSNIKDGIHNK